MTHEPECPNADGDCCPWIGQRTATGVCNCQCDCDRLRAAYRRGYTAGFNDHARAAQHWQDTHGAYRQHGNGENP